jgi:hypothetical protein
METTVPFPDRPLRDDDPARIVTRYTVGDWDYILDTFGDWRGVSGALRTRLKGTLAWAKQDVADRRFQRRGADGCWIDAIRA